VKSQQLSTTLFRRMRKIKFSILATQKSGIKTLPIFLFSFVFFIYLLGYNGVIIADDEEIFISASQNLVNVGEFSASHLLGNTRLQGMSPKAGLVHTILASPVYLLAKLLKVGSVQSVYLLPILYSSLTTVFIFHIGMQLGFKSRTSFIGALGLALTTTLWPYSQMFYREVLATLFFTLSFGYFHLIFASDSKSKNKELAIGFFCVSFLLSILTKISLITTAPIFLIFGIIRWGKAKENLNVKKWLVGLTLLVLLSLLVIFLTGKTRISTNYFETIFNAISENNFQDILKSFLGILFSPSKGLFIYNPIVILAFLSLFSKRKVTKKLSYEAWSILAVLTFAQLLIYADNWWGISWGTRFLLPCLPLLALSSLGLIEDILETKTKPKIILIFCLFALGFFIQLGRIFKNDISYLRFLYSNQTSPGLEHAIWDHKVAPIFVHWKLVFQNKSFDLALWREINSINLLGYILVTSFILCIGLFVWSYFSRSNGPSLNKISIPLLFIIVLVIPSLMLYSYKDDPRYFLDRDDLVAAREHLENNSLPQDRIFIGSYLYPVYNYFQNFGYLDNKWYSLPLPDEYTFFISSQRFLEEIILYKSDRAWLLWERDVYYENPSSHWTMNIFLEKFRVVSEISFPQSDQNYSLHLYLLEFKK